MRNEFGSFALASILRTEKVSIQDLTLAFPSRPDPGVSLKKYQYKT